MTASFRLVVWVFSIVVADFVGAVVEGVEGRVAESYHDLGFFLRSRQSFLAVEDHPLLCFL